jgi:hypothetical protein
MTLGGSGGIPAECAAQFDPASYLAAFTGGGPPRLRTGTIPVPQSGTLPLNLAVVEVR